MKTLGMRRASPLGMTAFRLPAFHLPVRPYSPIDALNRRAAALGSPRCAELTSHADYNGHHVTVSWNSYRNYYVAEYTWAGRVVLARGSFEVCLAAALAEYRRGSADGGSADGGPADGGPADGGPADGGPADGGPLGASASIVPREGDEAAVAACRAAQGVVEGDLWLENEDGTRSLAMPWWTWRHTCAVASVRDSANPHLSVLLFDWPLMQAAETCEVYEAALTAKYGRAWT